MVKCASVFTYEIDDKEKALLEIREQLKEKVVLQKNSVGILMCHPEFLLTDTLKYVCDNIGFDTLGVTTSSQAVNNETGEQMMLSIFVITSDDVEFRTALTESLSSEVENPTKESYKTASKGMNGDPKLVLAFPPLILKYPGDIYPNTFTSILPSTPVFGTIAIDHTVDFSQSETIFNGVPSKDKMAYCLCYGNLSPRFAVTTVSSDNTMPYTAQVTKASGAYVNKINNISALEYFESIGLAKKKHQDANNFLFMPILVDSKGRSDYDGVSTLRVLTTFTEDGSAVFRGDIEEMSVIHVSKFSEEAVLKNTEEFSQSISKLSDVNGVLSFPCIIRKMVLKSDPLAESKVYVKEMGNTPFMFGYAGGEICPTSVKNNKPANRFHNYSLVNLIL